MPYAGRCVCFVEILNVSSKPQGFRPPGIKIDRFITVVVQENGKYEDKIGI